MAFNINVGGQPKKVKDMYVNVGGVKKIVSGWVNDGTATPRKVFGNGGETQNKDILISGRYATDNISRFIKKTISNNMMDSQYQILSNIPYSYPGGGIITRSSEFTSGAIYIENKGYYLVVVQNYNTDVHAGKETTLFKSYDGINWEIHAQFGNALSKSHCCYSCIYYVNNKLVITNRYSKKLIYSEDDGETWNVQDCEQGCMSKIIYAYGKYIMTFGNGAVFSGINFSDDMINWDSSLSPIETGIGVAFGGGELCYTKNTYSITNGMDVMSYKGFGDMTNSDNWINTTTLETTGMISDIFYINDKFMIFDHRNASTHKIHYSTNLQNWTSEDTIYDISPKTNNCWVKNIHYSNGIYITEPNDGLAFYAYESDLTKWNIISVGHTVNGITIKEQD